MLNGPRKLFICVFIAHFFLNLFSAKDKVNYELDQLSASIATRTPLSIWMHITNTPDCECHSWRPFTENQSVFLVS